MEAEQLKGRHVGNMSGATGDGALQCQLWPSATLTTALRLRCEQVLTRLAASIHVTHDRPANLMETRDGIWNPRKSCHAGNCRHSICRVTS